MSDTADPRKLPWDWFPGTLPRNVELDPAAYVETAFSFVDCRSEAPVGVRLGRGASTYGSGTMFDVGPRGVVTVGDFAMINGARIICDSAVDIGHHALISWNVLLMDSYRASPDPVERRTMLHQASAGRVLKADVPARPVRIGANAWLGFGVCVLPGVTIGEGAIVGARSVVVEDVPAYTIAAGNPARVVRRLTPPADPHREDEGSGRSS